MTMYDVANRSDKFLRRALLADGVVSGLTGLQMIVGGNLLKDLLGLPATLMHYAGLSLIPFAVLAAFLATRQHLPRAAVIAVIAYNAMWTIDSVVLLLLTGWVAPTFLGYAFVIGQAVVVAAFAELQYVGLRRSDAAGR